MHKSQIYQKKFHTPAPARALSGREPQIFVALRGPRQEKNVRPLYCSEAARKWCCLACPVSGVTFAPSPSRTARSAWGKHLHQVRRTSPSPSSNSRKPRQNRVPRTAEACGGSLAPSCPCLDRCVPSRTGLLESTVSTDRRLRWRRLSDDCHTRVHSAATKAS